jgi:hypothetical protein
MLARAANPDEFLGHDFEFCNECIPSAYSEEYEMQRLRRERGFDAAGQDFSGWKVEESFSGDSLTGAALGVLG